MKNTSISVFTKVAFFCLQFIVFGNVHAQMQWATIVVDFSSEYKDDLIRDNSTRWSAVQVLGYPNSTKYASSQHAWTPQSQNNSKEFVTVGFATPQLVQQVIVGENYNSGAVAEIILYDTKGKKYTVYENPNPQPTYKMGDVLTYFKIKPTYNVTKLKLVINTNTTIGREEIDCIGISSNTTPYVQQINVLRYNETVGQPENLGPNVNSSYYDHLPLISPDGSKLYFTRKLSDDNNLSAFNDDIYYAEILPTGAFTKAVNIGPPLNTAEHNFACYISADNNRLYVANKYIKNTYNFSGLSVSTKQKDNTWSKPKPLPIPDLINKNEFAHYYLNITENVVLMSVQGNDSYGDLDLYVAQKYSDGTWTKPKNLGPTINTVGAEGSVFLAADGKTLYFSSTGHPGFGSYDMYMSKRLDDTWTNWSKPLNLGDKINSDEMDIYYTIPAAGDYAYFSSGKTMFGMNDLYRIRLPKEIRPEFVDMKKLVANNTTKSDNISTNSTLVAPKPTISTTPTKPAISTPTSTDELQKKLEALKQQQAAVQPNKTTTPTPTSATTPTVINKREVVNYIEPPKPVKPAPHVLTKEELAAREAQKNNPTINPADDNINSITKSPMRENVKTTVVAPTEKISAPTSPYQINEVNAPTSASEPTISSPNTLRTANIPEDDFQQKLAALKQQQQQANSQPNTTINTNSSIPKTIAEQYPNPQPVTTTYNAHTDQMEQKLEALKQQQKQVVQSTTIPSPYYYESKPYDPQPVKEKVDDKFSQEYDDYQKKLDDLKKQQKNPTVVTASATPLKTENVKTTPVVEEKPTVAYVPDEKQTQKREAVINKYEDKLKKLQEELANLNKPAVDDKVLPAITTVTDIPKVADVKPTLVSDMTQPSIQNDSIPVVQEEKSTLIHENTTVQTPSQPRINFDSIEQARKKIEQEMQAAIQKMDASKQTLENDISDLEAQRKSFNAENEKLLAQNSQLENEKEKLALEKKQMDDLLAKMQEERDKLAAEKQKMEQDKIKLELLRKQQEKEFFTMKNSIDSLSKVQQNVAKNAELQQKYDLFNVPIEVGAVAIADRIFFVADAAFLTIPSYPEMDKVVDFLKKNNTLKVEIGGHTNGLCDDVYCNKLSNDRAKTCVDYLIKKGIDKNRLSFKGYGKQHLIASPGSPLNQRVEIKIMSVK